MCGRSILTGRKCGLDCNRRLTGSAVMFSMLPRCEDMVSFSTDPCLMLRLTDCASVIDCCGDARRFRWLLLLDRLGTGGVGLGASEVAALADGDDCAFSDRACFSASFIALLRRRNGQNEGITWVVFQKAVASRGYPARCSSGSSRRADVEGMTVAQEAREAFTAHTLEAASLSMKRRCGYGCGLHGGAPMWPLRVKV